MKRAVYFMVLVGFGISAYAGEPDDQVQKNSIEVYFPVCHFFDGTETNWLLLAPQRSNRKFDQQGNLISYDKKYRLPLTFGLQYNFRLDPVSSLGVSAECYDRVYSHKNLPPPGTISWRLYVLLSIDYSRVILTNRNAELSVSGGIAYRHGNERVNLMTSHYEGIFEWLDLNDIGATVGLNYRRAVFYNFHLLGRVQYTRFAYRHSNGVDFFLVTKRPLPTL